MTKQKNLMAQVLDRQTAISEGDPILAWARKTLASAEKKGFGPVEATIDSTFGADDEGIYSEQSVTFIFPLVPSSNSSGQLEYRIKRQDDREVYIWCGPSHLPADDQTIEEYLAWMLPFIDPERR